MRRVWAWGGPLLLIVVTLPFAVHAVRLGWDAVGGPSAPTRFWHQGAWLANIGIFGHMVLGGLATALVPLQLIAGLRVRWPGLHRALGRGIVVVAGLSALGGLVYIAAKGTIGGPAMSLGFAAYGLCMAAAAVQTLRLARARDMVRHRRWALRLTVLVLGSWLYRVMYGVWVAATGGLGIGDRFDGPFDLAMNWAFFVPWLVLLELWLRRPGASGKSGTPGGSGPQEHRRSA